MNVNLAWNAPAVTTNIIGYRVYFGITSGVYTYNQDAGLVLSATITLPTLINDWFFAVVAYDYLGNESAVSNEIVYTQPTLVAVAATSAAPEDTGTLVFTFTRAPLVAGAQLVNFSVGGTATFTTDYTQAGAASFSGSAGTVTIPDGSATAAVTITPVSDAVIEPNETVILTVTAGSGYSPGSPAAATGTITNDDAIVTVAVALGTVAEDGVPNLLYTFTRAGVSSGALTINFSVGGTAAFGTDYAQSGAASFGLSSGTVVILAGSATAVITLDPDADAITEPDETVILTVLVGSGYTVGTPAAATGTITNDDAAVVPGGTFTAYPYANSRHGTISPATRQSGTSLTFTATPHAQHAVDRWLLDQVVVQEGGESYTATGVEGSNKILKVEFEDA